MLLCKAIALRRKADAAAFALTDILDLAREITMFHEGEVGFEVYIVCCVEIRNQGGEATVCHIGPKLHRGNYSLLRDGVPWALRNAQLV
jgi:hypothetical protein